MAKPQQEQFFRGPDQLRRAVHEGTYDERMEALRDPLAPPDILTEVAWTGSYDERCEALANPNAPARLLRVFGCVPTYWHIVGRNPAAPIEALAFIIEAGDPHACRAIASSPTCPPEVLEKLLSSSDEGVRQALAANEALPDEVREAARAA